jgi:hypothetical protein
LREPLVNIDLRTFPIVCRSYPPTTRAQKIMTTETGISTVVGGTSVRKHSC